MSKRIITSKAVFCHHCGKRIIGAGAIGSVAVIGRILLRCFWERNTVWRMR